MRLIYISSYNIPTMNALGIQITQMCGAFAQNGADVEIIVPKQKNKEKDIFEYYGIERNFKVKEVFRFNFSKFGKIGFIIQTFFYLIMVRFHLFSKRYDYVYTREQLAGLFFKGFVYESHNFPSKFTFFHKIIFGRAFKIIAITNFIKKDLIKNKVSYNKILVSPDAVDLEKFNTSISKSTAREEIGLPQDKKIIGYVGKYETFKKGNKGVDSLIEAFYEILKTEKDTFLLLVGVGKRNVENIEEKLKSFDISKENYKIISHLPYERVIYPLRASDILVMNYNKFRYHSFYTSPMKMFEYMASARPIIASDMSSVREVLNENNAFLIEPNSVESLVKGIKYLLQDKDLVDKLSERAYKDVQSYTWRNRAKNILNFLKK